MFTVRSGQLKKEVWELRFIHRAGQTHITFSVQIQKESAFTLPYSRNWYVHTTWRTWNLKHRPRVKDTASTDLQTKSQVALKWASETRVNAWESRDMLKQQRGHGPTRRQAPGTHTPDIRCALSPSEVPWPHKRCPSAIQQRIHQKYSRACNVASSEGHVRIER